MEKENILTYLHQIKNDLLDKGIKKIGLFGSFTKDKADSFSDIDIAIQINENYLDHHDVWEYFNLIESIKKKLLIKFSRKVDIYDLDSTGDIKDAISKDIIYV